MKRDLAVEARAAQRLERAKSGIGAAATGSVGGGSFPSSSQHRLSGRGRTRAAVQADLRPIRRHRKTKGNDDEEDDDDDDDEFVTDDDEEFDAAAVPGSRRSALRARVDAGPAARSAGAGIGARYAQDVSGGDESSNDDTWPAESSSGGGSSSSSSLEQLSSSGDDDERMDWGGAHSNSNTWRQQISGSPERSPRYLHHVSTPTTMISTSEYELSPSGSGGISGLDRISSVGSSLASSVSFASSPCHSDTMLHSSSPYQFSDCNENDSANNDQQHSPMSVHSAVGQAVASVQAAAVAAVTQVSPRQQRQHQDIDLSFSAVVDASINGWGSPQQSSSLSHPEHFGWGSASVAAAGDGAAGATSWSDAPSSPGAPQHQKSCQPLPPQEDFAFIDLFAANWDATGDGVPQLPPSPVDFSSSYSYSSSSSSSFSSSSGGDGSNVIGGDNVHVNDAFLKQAQAAGAFGGVEEFLIPPGSSGGGDFIGTFGGGLA